MRKKAGSLNVDVYFWGRREQDRLLTDCLGPAIARLECRGLVERFWFTRAGVRGPHLLARLKVIPGGLAEAERRLDAELEAYLAACPSAGFLTRGDLTEARTPPRGMALSPADRLPGLAPNNTYHLSQQTLEGPPFWIGSGSAQATELWRCLSDTAAWTIRQLAEDPMAAAVRWVAAVDRALARADADPAAHWRHQAAARLMPGREEPARESELLAAFPSLVGEADRTFFSLLFDEDEASAQEPPHVDRFLEIVCSMADPRMRRIFLCEIDHFTLKQLGVPPESVLRLVLYAWYRRCPFRLPKIRRAESLLADVHQSLTSMPEALSPWVM